MQEIEIKLNHKNGPISHFIELPAKWDELTSSQLLHIADRWHQWKYNMQNNISMRKEKVELFIKLISNKRRRELNKIIDVLSFVNEDTGVNILETTDFLFVDLNLTKNHLPFVKAGAFKRVYGPEDRLKNISINELSFAFFFYSAYNKTAEEKYLNLLFATLYRPYDKTGISRGDMRTPFNNHLIEINEKALRKVKQEYKQATLLYFMGCLEYMERKFPFVFKRTELKKNEKQGTGSLLNVIISISGGKFGDFDKTKEQNAYPVLTELNELLRPNKK